ncbi:diguanylate cyclase domain-containing protein [Streptomyces californicus]|uniref:diguanylate cyclase domain-containing protein n=1 Tax=Streptomyces californicus TaxID=67351 RepID=UPI0033FBB48C
MRSWLRIARAQHVLGSSADGCERRRRCVRRPGGLGYAAWTRHGDDAARDDVLSAFGTRLAAWAGPRAAVGRLGGDEFAVVLELAADRPQVRLEQVRSRRALTV